MAIINLTHVTPGKVLLTEFDSDDFDRTLGIYRDEMTKIIFKSDRSPELVKESPKKIIELISKSKQFVKSDDTSVNNGENYDNEIENS
jgi:hypothetical protein